MPRYLGLDCGGSSSRALLVDESGQMIFSGQSGPANLVSTPLARLRRNVHAAVRDCPTPDFVCGCFAGLISETTRSLALQLLREAFPKSRLRTEPDYLGAYYAFEDLIDICVVAGTGSLVCSVIDGRIQKSGGRGYVLGDAGSSMTYGRDALNAFLDNPTHASEALTKAVEKVFGSSDPTEILAKLYGSGTPAPFLAKLAKASSIDAKSGIKYAKESVGRNTQALASIIRDHTERHLNDRRNLRIGLAGGLWKASPIFKEEMESTLQELLLQHNMSLTITQRPPTYGAVALAKELEFGN